MLCLIGDFDVGGVNSMRCKLLVSNVPANHLIIKIESTLHGIIDELQYVIQVLVERDNRGSVHQNPHSILRAAVEWRTNKNKVNVCNKPGVFSWKKDIFLIGKAFLNGAK